MARWMRDLHAQGLREIARDASPASARAQVQGAWSAWCAGAGQRLERVALESIVYVPGRGWDASRARGAGKLAIAWERHAGRRQVGEALSKRLARAIYDASEAHVSGAALRRLLATHDPEIIKRGVERLEALRDAHEDPPSGWQTTVRCVEAAGAWGSGTWAAARSQIAWVGREAVEAAGEGAIDPGEPRTWLARRARAACATLGMEIDASDEEAQAEALASVLETWRWPEIRPPLGAALACALQGGAAPNDWGWGGAKSWEEGEAFRQRHTSARAYAQAVHRNGEREEKEIESRIAQAGREPEGREDAVRALERAWGSDPTLKAWRASAHPIVLMAHSGGQMAWYVVYASPRRLALGTPPREGLGDEMRRHEGVRINVGWTGNQRGWSWEKRKPADDGLELGEAIEAITQMGAKG